MKSLALILASCFAITGCRQAPITPDTPRLGSDVRMDDVTFHSAILNRDMHIRLIYPKAPPDHLWPVVYLLHGAGQDYRDWSNHSDIADFATTGHVLVMPDAKDSYYINEASGTSRRYEDYFIHEVIPEVHRHFAVAQDRNHTAVVGISRGGYGAVVLGLKHPELFGFVGDLSGAVDFPERRFRWKTPLVSMGNRKVFGSAGSRENQLNDPFDLLKRIPAPKAPYFFISCGDRDPLMEPNKRLAFSLQKHGIPVEFHQTKGGHDWSTWSADVPLLEAALSKWLISDGGVNR